MTEQAVIQLFAGAVAAGLTLGGFIALVNSWRP